MAITPSGKVVPCQSWLSDDAIGDMLTDEWIAIWNNDKCKERRDYSAEMAGQCPLRKFRDENSETAQHEGAEEKAEVKEGADNE